jgi:hypothetical protein
MESLRANEKQIFFDDLKNAQKDSKRTANRDHMAEARERGTYGFHYGLARQSVDSLDDGKIILSESSFAGDGFFNAKYVLIDPIAKSATAWEGQAVNNPDYSGRLWQLSDDEYEQTMEVVNSLQTDHSL